MAKWTAPVLEELSIPAGTFGSLTTNGAQDTVAVVLDAAHDRFLSFRNY